MNENGSLIISVGLRCKFHVHRAHKVLLRVKTINGCHKKLFFGINTVVFRVFYFNWLAFGRDRKPAATVLFYRACLKNSGGGAGERGAATRTVFSCVVKLFSGSKAKVPR